MDGAELCRNSSYSQLLRDVLHDLGYKFKLVSTAVFEKGGLFALPQFLRQFMDNFSMSDVLREISLAISKMNVLDQLERRVQFIRPREITPGSVEKVWKEGIARTDEASNQELLKQARLDMLRKLDQVEIDPARRPVKVATTGEYYAVLEPFFNLDIERVLGQLGAEVHRTLMLGDWVKITMILEALGIHKSEIDRAARPYLRWNIGGEGLVTVGQSVIHARKGFHGIVELLPFTCIPEITVLNILPRIRRDLNIPIIPFILDEQSGQAGMKTRLEAFVDLLYRRRDASSVEVV
jgi:predicted nucleotide-binding protein (sugar kinase/HSP70/actin superfamily)